MYSKQVKNCNVRNIVNIVCSRMGHMHLVLGIVSDLLDRKSASAAGLDEILNIRQLQQEGIKINH